MYKNKTFEVDKHKSIFFQIETPSKKLKGMFDTLSQPPP